MAQTVDVDYFGCPQPADGGRYVLQKGSWFCLTCNSVAADSHVSCRRHAMWVEEYKSGRMLLPMALENSPPPPPTGQPSAASDWSWAIPIGPPPPAPLGQARDPHQSAAIPTGPPPPAPQSAAIAIAPPAESLESINQKLTFVSSRLHMKLDLLMAKVSAMETKLDVIDRKMNALCYHLLPEGDILPAEE